MDLVLLIDTSMRREYCYSRLKVWYHENEIFISLIVPTGLWNCRQHTSARNICNFFNEMHFKPNYDQVFNDNDI
jgi:hypothetical protein